MHVQTASQVAAALRLERSLFERIQAAAPACVKLLSVQYRMHPMIRQFPSQVSSSTSDVGFRWRARHHTFDLSVATATFAETTRVTHTSLCICQSAWMGLQQNKAEHVITTAQRWSLDDRA